MPKDPVDDTDGLGAAPKVHALAAVADRAERARLLTELMRDTGARTVERIAAAKALEALDTAGDDDDSGPPAPTTRAEQVARLVRMLVAAHDTVRTEALELVGRRFRQAQTAIAGLSAQPQMRTFDSAGETSALAPPASEPTTEG